MALLYVSTTGSDTNSGAFTSPVKSITKAAQLAEPGDTVMVHGGVYSGLVRIEKSGTASAPITFKAVEGEKPVIDGLGTPANTHLVIISADYVTFQGFEVRNSTSDGIMTWNAHDVKILNNNVHDNTWHGIYALGGDNVSSYNTLIEGNEVWNNVTTNANRATSQPWAQALSVHKSDNSVIKNNYVHDNYGEGIDAIATKGARIIGNTLHDNYSVNIYLDNAQDAVVQGNTVYHTYDEAFYAWGGPARGVLIANEFTDRMLPSSGITVTNNVLAGVGNVTYASNYGANTGLIDSTIAPNTVHATPDGFIGTPPVPIDPATPTPDVVVDDGFIGTPPVPIDPATPTPDVVVDDGFIGTPPVPTDPATPTPDVVVDGGFTGIRTGSDTLTLKISQDAYQGDSKYVVTVDGKQVGGEFTAKALHGSGSFDTLEIKGDWGVGNHTVSVRLTNDLYDGTPTTDRNIWLESATYNDRPVSGSAVFVNSATPKSITVSDTTAIPTPDIFMKQTKKELILSQIEEIAEDLAAGDLQAGVFRFGGVRIKVFEPTSDADGASVEFKIKARNGFADEVQDIINFLDTQFGKPVSTPVFFDDMMSDTMMSDTRDTITDKFRIDYVLTPAGLKLDLIDI